MECLSVSELADYPCLSLEQGEGASYYFAEVILSTEEYHRTIKANYRATIKNFNLSSIGAIYVTVFFLS